MGRNKDPSKPRGRMSSYAYFVQTCREEHKKKHPGESVVFTEFTKKCAEKWKKMGPKEKKTFEDMAEKDKTRYQKEMANYVPPKGSVQQGKKRRKPKDPNAPKRALSAFFFFCGEERSKVKELNPSQTIGEIAKELGKRWEVNKEKPRFESLAKKDKERYEKEMTAYKKGEAFGSSLAKKAKPAAAEVQEEEEEEEEGEEEEEEEEEEDDDEEDDS